MTWCGRVRALLMMGTVFAGQVCIGQGVIPGATSSNPGQPYAAVDHAGAAAWFVDVAGKAGISVRNVNGDPAVKKYIIEATGSGVGIIDFDRDGLPDIFLVNGRGLEKTSVHCRIFDFAALRSE